MKKKSGKKANILLNEYGLTPLQERFCQLYAGDREFYGNGVETYLEVFNINKKNPNYYAVARSEASKLLTKPNIMARINDLLHEGGLNDEFVDKQHLFVIAQHANLAVKMEGIKEYNRLKKRIEDKMNNYMVINLSDVLARADQKERGNTK